MRNPEQIVRRHFGESLFAASLIASKCENPKSVTDVGSGAGFPGIPIKILMSGLRLTLIESQHKKATFLREVIRTLDLTDAQVANSRAEEVSLTADVVTLRAVESFEQVLPIARKLLGARGALVLLVGDSQVPRAEAILQDLLWQAPIAIPESDRRVALLGTRTS